MSSDRLNLHNDEKPRGYFELIGVANDEYEFLGLMLVGVPSDDESPWVAAWRAQRRRADEVMSHANWEN